MPLQEDTFIHFCIKINRMIFGYNLEIIFPKRGHSLKLRCELTNKIQLVFTALQLQRHKKLHKQLLT